MDSIARLMRSNVSLWAYRAISDVKEHFLSMLWTADDVREACSFLWCHAVMWETALEGGPLNACQQMLTINILNP